MCTNLASAQRVNVKASDSFYTITMLKAQILRRDINNSNNKVELFYDTDDKTLYLSVHAKSNGTLYLQKPGKRTGETVEQCINRLLSENAHLFSNLQVNKVVLIACYQASRHKDNSQNTHIGHFDLLNVDIEEISAFDGVLCYDEQTERNIIKTIIYDSHAVFSSDKDKDIRIAKDAAKANDANWAIDLLNNIKTGKVKIVNPK